MKKISRLKIQDWLLTCDEHDISFFQSHRYKCILNAFLKFLALNFYHSKLHNNSNSIYVSMTSLMEHSVAQPKKMQIFAKNFLVAKLGQKSPNFIFQSQFYMSKISLIILFI